MRRTILIALLFVPRLALAQPSMVEWDQLGPSLTEIQAYTYAFCIDHRATCQPVPPKSVLCAVLPNNATPPNAATCAATLPVEAAGQHVVQMTATNAAGVSPESLSVGFCESGCSTLHVTPDVVSTWSDVFQSTSSNFPIPAHLTVGMLLIVGLTCQSGQTYTAVTMDGGSSGHAWTKIDTSKDTGNDKFVFYKVADASDVADSTATGKHWTVHLSNGFIEQGALAGWSGANPSAPFLAGPTVQHASAKAFAWTSLSAPAANSVWAGLLLLSNNSTSLTTPPPVLTKQIQSSSQYYFGPAIVYSTAVPSGATSTFAGGAIQYGFEWATVAFVLNPGS
jgi:hypothetical protein